ncbi:MAG: FKBP-type peptidyl-prolyl cis-trans isomerase [Prevotella sp.]|nr:FKBP-type peptidyl-prolyl cis-trans isomerase [Prevotella sp.]
MAESKNKYIAVQYKLYTVDERGEHLVEQTTPERPFDFISGFGFALEAFEDKVKDLEKGQTFTFQLSKDEAYGDREEERVIDLDREVFTIDGKFDEEHIYRGAVVPLQNEDGNHFYGRVVQLTEEQVRIDLNHPLAGETLLFSGLVTENRDATNEEIQQLINQIHGECDCDDCGCDHNSGNGCGCGHCHH